MGNKLQRRQQQGSFYSVADLLPLSPFMLLNFRMLRAIKFKALFLKTFRGNCDSWRVLS
jgi:hypothetical protein